MHVEDACIHFAGGQHWCWDTTVVDNKVVRHSILSLDLQEDGTPSPWQQWQLVGWGHISFPKDPVLHKITASSVKWTSQQMEAAEDVSESSLMNGKNVM